MEERRAWNSEKTNATFEGNDLTWLHIKYPDSSALMIKEPEHSSCVHVRVCVCVSVCEIYLDWFRQAECSKI